MSLTTTLRPRVLLFLALATAALAGGLSAPVVGQASATVFEGARLINGTGGPPVENAAFVVEGTRITQVGRAGQVKAPAGAARVSLAGKTVMPAIVDTHTHLASERDALVEQLQGKAYYGVAAAMSLGQDAGDVAFQVRAKPSPARRVFRRPAAASRCRSRAAPTCPTGSAPRPRRARPCRSWPRKKWTSSRFGWTTATASTRS